MRSIRFRQGSVLVVALVVAFVAIASVGSMLQLALVRTRASARGVAAARAFYIADGGVSEAYADVCAGGSGDLGSEAEPALRSGGECWVDTRERPGGDLDVTSTVRIHGATRTVEVTIRIGRFDPFSRAVFGRERVRLAANSAVDSWDSRLGPYALQAVNKAHGVDYARDDAAIGSNGDIELSSNSKVFGDAHPGPGGTVVLASANVIVTGSTAPAAAAWEPPDVRLPYQFETWDDGGYGRVATMSGGNHVLEAGRYWFEDLALDGAATLTIEGPSRVVVGSLLVPNQCRIQVDATGGPVQLYVIDSLRLESGADLGSSTGRASDLLLLVATDNLAGPIDDTNRVSIHSNVAICAAVYAPRAEVVLRSNSDVFGSIVAGRVVLEAGAGVHYDQALRGWLVGDVGDPSIDSWSHRPRGGESP